MTYQSLFKLGHVALYVKDLQLQGRFYQQVLGLELLAEREDRLDLGVGQELLIRLIKTQHQEQASASYGLYHLALLVPERQDLANLFKHFVDNKIVLVGASDHDYSEAIYLEDLEGNGIEVYRDRPMSNWDIRENGQIVGDTRPFAEEEIYHLGKSQVPYRLPHGTRMGHVHLSVKDSRASRQFYQQLLGVDNKFSLPSASWLASGHYHHHLAVNEWGGKELKARKTLLPGLAYYTIIYQDMVHFYHSLQQAKRMNLQLELSPQEVIVQDPDGIRFKLILEKR
ncbi:VOC family protein [Streptococcus sp. sy010]|nr:VOC family protein [Streptococcus sp. sy010]TWT16771.1 VOC family protein [Streptococcus sp. sy010]